MVNDEGPSQLTNAYSAFNTITNGVAPEMFNISGSYNNVFRIGYRPANNGTLLYVQGGEPVSPNAKPYYIFQDNQTVAGKLGFNPISGVFSFNGAVTAPSIRRPAWRARLPQERRSAEIFLVCRMGQIVRLASGSERKWSEQRCDGGVAELADAFGDEPTTTPSVTVAASPIPNGALANSATTVNGQTCALGSACTIGVVSTQVTGTLSATQLPVATASTQGVVQLPGGATSNVLGAAAMQPASTTVNGTTCALGGSCTIATGSITPPLTYTYFPAAVSDGGAAYAGAFARYNNNEPQAGSVAPTSSALGYLLFQAAPTSRNMQS